MSAKRGVNGKNSPWNQLTDTVLKKAWKRGSTCKDIAAEIGQNFTKDMVISRARRLRLVPRRKVVRKPHRDAKVAVGVTVARLPVPVAPAVVYSPHTTCQFPHGDPRKPGFHFCGAETALGRPYCETHVRLCYTGSPVRSAA